MRTPCDRMKWYHSNKQADNRDRREQWDDEGERFRNKGSGSNERKDESIRIRERLPLLQRGYLQVRHPVGKAGQYRHSALLPAA